MGLLIIAGEVSQHLPLPTTVVGTAPQRLLLRAISLCIIDLVVIRTASWPHFALGTFALYSQNFLHSIYGRGILDCYGRPSKSFEERIGLQLPQPFIRPRYKYVHSPLYPEELRFAPHRYIDYP